MSAEHGSRRPPRKVAERGAVMKLLNVLYAAVGFAVARWIFQRRPVVDPVSHLRSRGLL